METVFELLSRLVDSGLTEEQALDLFKDAILVLLSKEF